MRKTPIDPMLPILDELGRALHEASASAERTQAADRRSAVRMTLLRLFRRPLLALSVVAIAGGGAAALAASLSGGGHGVSTEAWLHGAHATPESVVQLDQSARLAILRRPRETTDAVPSSVTAVLSKTLFSSLEGASFALSREAHGLPAGSRAWVVPGIETICLIAQPAPPAGDKPDRHGGANCMPDGATMEGEDLVYGSTDSTQRNAGVAMLAGVAPDGVSSVTAQLAQGPPITLAVHENIYIGAVHGSLTALILRGSNGEALDSLTGRQLAGLVGTPGQHPPPLSPRSLVVPEVKAASEAVLSQLGILARPRTPADVLPQVVEENLAERLPGSGANGGLARLARYSPEGKPVFLIPSAEGVCMLNLQGTESGCESAEALASGTVMGQTLCAPMSLPTDEIEIAGILPDGAHDTRVLLTNGSVEPFAVEGNVYILDFPRNDPMPKDVEWQAADGQLHIDEAHVPGGMASEHCVTPAEAQAPKASGKLRPAPRHPPANRPGPVVEHGPG